MNTEILRRKRVLVPAIGTVAALAIGTTAWSASANNVTGSERDRVAEAAIKIVGGGTAEDVEHGDDASEAYEVEVRRANGTEVEVSLDKNLKEVRTEVDNDDDGDDDGRDNDDGDDDTDDRALSAKEKSSATKAALKAVSGTVTDVEASDDPGTSYEVEVRTAQGVEWDIDLDRNFAVVSKTKDD
jgi:uncharacterized membrane protein YkoI